MTEKKTTTVKKDTGPSKPTFQAMCTAAIASSTERKGISRQRVCKYLSDNYGVCQPGSVELTKQGKMVNRSLVILVKKGTVIKCSGMGASGSFKMVIKPKTKKVPAKTSPKKEATKKSAAPASKKRQASATKKTAPKKKTTIKKKTPSKPAKAKVAAKKTSARKPATKKAAPKKRIAVHKKKAVKK
jgi:hypothetical protein